MQITYKRNGLRNYLVVKNDRNEAAGLHEKMIVRNQIGYLARMTPQSIDGHSYYYYDIQGRVSLMTMFAARSLTYTEISAILGGLAGLLTELQRYLLSSEEVLFDPGNIWLSPDTLEPEFIYVPGLMHDEAYDIRSLAVFLTEHVDAGDREAAGLAYEYLEMVENGYIIPGNVDHRSIPGGEPARNIRPDPIIEEGGRWDIKEGISDEMKSFFEEESDVDGEERGVDKKKLSLILIIAAVCLSVIYIVLVMEPSWFPFYLTDEEYMIAGAVIAAFFAVTIVTVMWLNRTSGKKETLEPELKDDDPLPAYEKTLEEEAVRETLRPEYPEPVIREDDDRTVLLKRPVFGGPSYGMPVMMYEDGRQIRIRQFPCLFGKMQTRVDEVVEGKGISRIHAMIKEQDGRYFLSDLNSLNGTGVNGTMLGTNETVEIFDGDVILMADTPLTFKSGSTEKAMQYRSTAGF